MSQISDVNEINYSTAFLTDKICGILSNTFTASSYNLGGALYQYTIPHTFTRPVFCDALFSTTDATYVTNGESDGTNSYNIYSDANNVYLITTATSGEIYYKQVSTWISNYDDTNPLISPVFAQTLPYTNSTNFDSRQNYQKIFAQGILPLNNPGTGNTGTHNLAHNLGYKPNYKIFFESLPGQVWPSISGGTQDTWLYDDTHQYECYGVMGNNNLTLTYNGGSGSASTFRVWYRIYYGS